MNRDWASKTEPAPNLTWVKIYELVPASNLEKPLLNLSLGRTEQVTHLTRPVAIPLATWIYKHVTHQICSMISNVAIFSSYTSNARDDKTSGSTYLVTWMQHHDALPQLYKKTRSKHSNMLHTSSTALSRSSAIATYNSENIKRCP